MAILGLGAEQGAGDAPEHPEPSRPGLPGEMRAELCCFLSSQLREQSLVFQSIQGDVKNRLCQIRF